MAEKRATGARVTLILVAMSRQYESYVPIEKIELVAPLQYGFEVPVWLFLFRSQMTGGLLCFARGSLQ